MIAPRHRFAMRTEVQRSRHWIIVAGRATDTIAPDLFAAGVGERVDVPSGCVHGIGNDGDRELIGIEVQLGTGESGVLRLVDDHAR